MPDLAVFTVGFLPILFLIPFEALETPDLILLNILTLLAALPEKRRLTEPLILCILFLATFLTNDSACCLDSC